MRTWLWSLPLAACSLTPVEPVGELAEHPYTVLVLPVRDDTHTPGIAGAFAATAAVPLRERGYFAIPAPVSSELLGSERLQGAESASPELYAWARAHGVDALLAIRVVHWDAWWWGHGLRSLDAVVHYRLVSCRHGHLLWQRESKSAYEYSGGWGPFPRQDYVDLPPRWTPIEVVGQIQRGALRYLPPHR